jgi:excisionase family DNA binding protein
MAATHDCFEGSKSLPIFATRRRIAEHFGVGERLIVRAIRAGELTEYRVGAWGRIRVSDAEAWIESHRRGAA